MSYWGGASSPAWAASRGPSPVVPLLIVVALVWIICNQTLSEWYEQVTEVQETVMDNTVLLLLGAGLLVLAAAVFGNRGEVVLVPVALALVIFLLQNIMVTVLLLLVVAYFAGIYYYRPDRRYGYGIASGGGDLGSAGAGGSSGLGSTCCWCCAWCSAPCSPRMAAAGGYQLCCWLDALPNVFSGGKVWGYEYF
jgi:hypothetical protein